MSSGYSCNTFLMCRIQVFLSDVEICEIKSEGGLDESPWEEHEGCL